MRQPASVRSVLEFALRAPSVHNSQPWRFRAAGDDVVEVSADLDKQLPAVDPAGRQLYVSQGALIASARWAARGLGVTLQVEGRNPARLRVTGAEPARPDALAALARRSTVRTPYAPEPLSDPCRAALEALEVPGAQLVVVEDRNQLEQLAELVAIATRRAFASAEFREELAGRLGTGGTEDGLLAPAEGLARAGRWLQAKALEHVDLGVFQASDRRRCMVASSAVILVVTARDDADAWVAGGEAMAEAWLTASAHGLCAQPMTAAIESPPERALLDQAMGEGTVQAMLRVGRSAEQPAPTLRAEFSAFWDG